MKPFKVYGFWVELTLLDDGCGVKINCFNKRMADKIFKYLESEGFLEGGGVLFY